MGNLPGELVVIGIDAASKSGYAVVAKYGGQKERLLERGAMRADNYQLMHELGERWRGRLSLATIEKPFQQQNRNTTALLDQIAGRWQFVMGRIGVRWEVRFADQWQKEVLTGLIAAGTKRDARKLAARRWVNAWFGVSVTDEDEADAIGLAVAAARRHAFAARAGIAV